MRNRTWLTSLFLSLTFGFLSFTLLQADRAEAKIVSKSKLRKIKKGVGNCVFANQALPYEKEKKYKGVSRSFATGDAVHARCYWPGQLQEAAAWGKTSNELRDGKGKYRISLQIQPGAAPEKKRKRRRKNRSKKAAIDPALMHPLLIALVRGSGSEEWDQRDYDLRPDARRCIFPSQYGVSKCLHLDAAVAAQAKILNKALPYTAEVCLKTYVEFVEKVGQEPQEKVLSRGCFNYTATQVPEPAPLASE